MKIAITVDENNIVKSVCRCISNKVKYDGILINCDLQSAQGIVDNYKYVDGALVELTEEEKQTIIETLDNVIHKTQQNSLEQRILDIEEALVEIIGGM